MMKFACLTTAFLCAIIAVDGYKVLGVFPLGTKSHFAIGHSIIKSLLDVGHEVTVISPYPQKKPVKNYHDVDVSSVLEQFKKGKIFWTGFENQF